MTLGADISVYLPLNRRVECLLACLSPHNHSSLTSTGFGDIYSIYSIVDHPFGYYVMPNLARL